MVLAAAVAGSVYWFYFRAPDRAAEVAKAREYLANNSATAVTYSDPVYGYSLDYPSGYSVANDFPPGVRTQIGAAIAGAIGEIIDVSIVSPAASVDEFETQFKENANQSSLRRFAFNNAEAVTVSYEYVPDFTDSRLFFRQAYFPCAFENGTRYGVMLTAMIPEDFASDTTVSDLAVNSFKC